jgi:hypothetical protein
MQYYFLAHPVEVIIKPEKQSVDSSFMWVGSFTERFDGLANAHKSNDEA